MPGRDRVVLEKLEVLAGDRRGDKSRAAVRLQDLDAVLLIPATLNIAEAAGSTPTKAEFDALVAAVNEIHARMFALADALKNRRRS